MQQHYSILVFLLVIFIIGVIFGAAAIYSLDFNSRQNLFLTLNHFFQGFQEIEYENPILFNQMTRIYFSSLFFIFLCGIVIIALPLIPVLLFLKAFSLGFTTAFLLTYFDLKGLLLILLTVIPQNIISIPVYFLACVIAMVFSIKIFNHLRGRKKLSMVHFADYFLKIILLAFLLLISVLIEVYLSPFLFSFLLNIFS